MMSDCMQYSNACQHVVGRFFNIDVPVCFLHFTYHFDTIYLFIKQSSKLKIVYSETRKYTVGSITVYYFKQMYT